MSIGGMEILSVAVATGVIRVCGTTCFGRRCRFRPTSVCDVPWSPHKSIGYTPSLTVLIQIDDPNDVIVAVARFDQIRNPFACWTLPPATANNDSNKRWV